MTQGRRNRGVRATRNGIEILQKRRHSKGWTLQKLANQAGVALGTVKRLIRGIKNVDRESVGKIAYALNLSPTDLMDSTEWDPQDSEETRRARICISDGGDSLFRNRCLESNLDLTQQLSNKLKAMGQDVFIAGEKCDSL